MQPGFCDVVAAYWEDMPTSLRYDRAIAAGTSRRAAGLFLCSNLPYLLLGLLFSCAPRMRLPHGWVCSRRELYVVLSVIMFAVSLLMHMSQLQCCGCHGMRRSWLVWLKQADVVCVLTMIATPMVCDGSLVPAGYMVPCLPLFVLSQHYKKEGCVRDYLLWHSLWHVATAASAAWFVAQHWLA